MVGLHLTLGLCLRGSLGPGSRFNLRIRLGMILLLLLLGLRLTFSLCLRILLHLIPVGPAPDEQAAGTSTGITREPLMNTITYIDSAWLQRWIQLLLQQAGVSTCSASASTSAHPFNPFSSGSSSQSAEEDSQQLADDILIFLASSASISREHLLAVLENGVSWLVEHYPDLMQVLIEFAVASVAPAICFDKKSRLRRDLGRRRRRDTEMDRLPDQTEILCRKLFLGFVTEMWKKPPKNAMDDECQRFDDMIVTLMVGSHWGDGTWSRVSYRFDREGEYVEAADGLSRKGCVETRIPLETVYGSPTVPVEAVKYFSIYDIITSDDLSDNWLFAGDAWNLRDMEMHLKARHRGDFDAPSQIWRALIKPDDWTRYEQDEVLSLCKKGTKPWPAAARPELDPNACSTFEELKVEMKMGTGFVNLMDYAGTYDNLMLEIGNQTLLLAEHPNRGETFRETIDLEKAFGSEGVAVQNIESFRLYPVEGQRINPDRWKLEVYRGDSRPPDVIRASGGFHPWGEYWHDDTSFSLENHLFINEHFLDAVWEDMCDDDESAARDRRVREAWNVNFTTAYVSTSTSPQEAAEFAPGGWIYVIQATPNMLVMEENFFDEVLALGGIHWSQVRGYTQVGGWSRPPFTDRIREGQFTLNQDFDQHRWGALTASRLPEDWNHRNPRQSAVALMQSVGRSVGWTGSFPLLPTLEEETLTVVGPPGRIPAIVPSSRIPGTVKSGRIPATAPGKGSRVVPEALPGPSGEATNLCQGSASGSDRQPCSADGRRRYEPRDFDIPEHVRRRVEQGIQTEDDCAYIFSRLAASFPALLQTSIWKRSESSICHSLFAKFPRTYLFRLFQGEKGKCPPCKTIDRLEIGVWISPDFTSGTWDTILAAISGKQPHVFIAREPEAGFQDWKAFNLKQIFGSRRVAVWDVDRISIVDVAQEAFYQKDPWVLQVIVIIFIFIFTYNARADLDSTFTNGNFFSLINQLYNHNPLSLIR
ncbi:hypothetical protein CP533_0081 [Ophiocordyceps camponoti-saundersi (nom. inval.)]|nr:hypothetical protein CP533_0081 [Ophiocordyceps camponoti-saundersi (nom. inval.)]